MRRSLASAGFPAVLEPAGLAVVEPVKGHRAGLVVVLDADCASPEALDAGD